MKSFRQVIAEVAEPNSRAEEEQAFKDMHTYEVIGHPVALDHQFTGEIAKPKAARIADQEGDANYDTAYAYGMNAMYDKAFAIEQVNENAAEEIPMMSQQLDFIAMAAKAIKASLSKGGDPEEWYQNKLATAHEAIKTLHANIASDVTESEMAKRDALDKAAAPSKEGKKAVSLKKAPWDKTEELSPKQKKIDHNKNGKIDGHDLAMIRAKKNEEAELDEVSQETLKDYHAKAAVDLRNKREKLRNGTLTSKDLKGGQNRVKGLNRAADKMEEVVAETTNSALKKPITMTGADGKTRTVMKSTKSNYTDERGQDKITTKESVDRIDEAFSAGIVKFKDNTSAIIKKEDADILNKLFKKMSSASVKKMTETAMKNKAGMAEILEFAREAL